MAPRFIMKGPWLSSGQPFGPFVAARLAAPQCFPPGQFGASAQTAATGDWLATNRHGQQALLSAWAFAAYGAPYDEGGADG